jgi:membrane dipeptidase
MKRRDIIKSLALLPIAGSVQSLLANSAKGEDVLSSSSAHSQLDYSFKRKSFVMDGHVHVISRQLLEGLDIGQRYPDGHIDLPRAREGGIDAMFFSVYTPEEYYPGRFETKNTFRIIELALDQIEKNNNVIELAHTASEIEQINRRGKMAAFLDLEGSFDLDGDLNLLRALYRLGLRSMQLTAHNATNTFIDSCCDVSKWGGLSPHGKEVVAEMNRLGMLINVAHASDAAILQAADISRHPILYTHGGFRGYVNQPRCITDEGAKALAAKGGVIGLQFGSGFNRPTQSKKAESGPRIVPSTAVPLTTASMTIEEVDKEVAKSLPFVSNAAAPAGWNTDEFVKAIDYGVNLIGEDHVALGSDFDGGMAPPPPMKDASGYQEMAKAMQRFGYSEKRISKIMGLNWLRVIRQVTERR